MLYIGSIFSHNEDNSLVLLQTRLVNDTCSNTNITHKKKKNNIEIVCHDNLVSSIQRHNKQQA